MRRHLPENVTITFLYLFTEFGFFGVPLWPDPPKGSVAYSLVWLGA